MHQTVTGKCKSTEDLALQLKICNLIRDGPFDIKGETGIFLKIVCNFPTKKIKCLEIVKNKKLGLHSVNFFRSTFTWEI